MSGKEFLTEEEKVIERKILDRRAKNALEISRILAILAPLFSLVLIVSWFFFQRYGQLLAAAVFAWIVELGVLGLHYFNRRGKPNTGIYLFLLSLLVYTGIVPLFMPAVIISTAIVVMMLAVLSYHLLGLHARTLVIVSLLVFFLDLVLAYVFEINLFPAVSEIGAPMVGAALAMLASIITVMVVGLSFKEHEVSMRNSLSSNQAIEQLARIESEQRQRQVKIINNYVETMLKVGSGNLAAKVVLDTEGQPSNDPLLVLGSNLNQMTNSLHSAIQQIREAANNLSAVASEIQAATTEQAAGSSQQSAAISQTTTTVDEVKTIAEQVSLRAQEVANSAQRTVEVSRAGQRAVQDTIQSMAEIKEKVESIAENILALSERTQQIGEIITTVSNIAAQSNMLALNAAVEAARAGEHGRGFGVVAMEIRSLAEQSKRATAQVKTILSEIQRATNTTVMATEEGAKQVDEGVDQVARAQKAIEQLACSIDESAQAAMQMSAGGRQQAAGIDQVAAAMRNINQATVQGLASTRQAEKAAQDLNELARQLMSTVEQYEL